jgi:hypothetical protein
MDFIIQINKNSVSYNTFSKCISGCYETLHEADFYENRQENHARGSQAEIFL